LLDLTAATALSTWPAWRFGRLELLCKSEVLTLPLLPQPVMVNDAPEPRQYHTTFHSFATPVWAQDGSVTHGQTQMPTNPAPCAS